MKDNEIAFINGTLNTSILCIVGESIKKINGLGPRMVNTLWRNGIEVKSVSDGASETTIAIVVGSEDASKALTLIHEAAIE